jgi:hypothetical protein
MQNNQGKKQWGRRLNWWKKHTSILMIEKNAKKKQVSNAIT